jgi:hypothetical protein
MGYLRKRKIKHAKQIWSGSVPAKSDFVISPLRK